MLSKQENETALHIAAYEGHTEVVCVLLALVEDHNTNDKITRMTDASGDTALHKAVMSQHLDVVKLLVKEDSDFEFPPNHAQETPLYLAAESGFHNALINILESCNNPTYAAGPSNKTPLHAAVIQEHKGLKDVVSDMLGWKKSLVYLPAGSENDLTTAIHIAACKGDVNMIKKLLNHCPDCCDTRNSNNQNALHVAVLKNQDKVVRVLLGYDKYENLVDEPDSSGNTPLHLFAASGNHVPELINHPRAKKMSFNKQNQTPLDIALSCAATQRSIGRFGKRDSEVKRKYEYMPNPNDGTGTGAKMQLREDDHDKANKADQAEVERDFESDSDSPNQGMVILIRKTSFRAFVVSDAISFTFSAVAILIYFLMAAQIRIPQHKKIVWNLYKIADRKGHFGPLLVRDVHHGQGPGSDRDKLGIRERFMVPGYLRNCVK
ncbi:hypothetical protein CQW23_13241 [Capsicum baccatum]|uniref:PGG domain-containing protein n=1 Tax=Capsicum baccatum TaxID=33114 RepID=A0A2G2WUY1_CAPBA|nr:hypothetical protein CQW23_13241 [Capsicum baccatum]